MKGIAISSPIIKKDKNSGIFIEKLNNQVTKKIKTMLLAKIEKT